MPRYRMALAPGGSKRLAIVVPRFRRTVSVELDGELVGTMPVSELSRGRAFELADGARLRVREESATGFATRLRVEWNGQLLPDCSAHPSYDIRTTASYLLFFGSAFLVVGIGLAADGMGFGPHVPWGGVYTVVSLLSVGAAYVVLAVFTAREHRSAVVAALALTVLDAVTGIFVLGGVGCGSVLARVLLVLALVNGLLAFRELRWLETKNALAAFR